MTAGAAVPVVPVPRAHHHTCTHCAQSHRWACSEEKCWLHRRATCEVAVRRVSQMHGLWAVR